MIGSKIAISLKEMSDGRHGIILFKFKIIILCSLNFIRRIIQIVTFLGLVNSLHHNKNETRSRNLELIWKETISLKEYFYSLLIITQNWHVTSEIWWLLPVFWWLFRGFWEETHSLCKINLFLTFFGVIQVNLVINYLVSNNPY